MLRFFGKGVWYISKDVCFLLTRLNKYATFLFKQTADNPTNTEVWKMRFGLGTPQVAKELVQKTQE